MDPKKNNNNIRAMTYPTKSQFLKKITKLVLSLSLFSLLLSSSWFSFLKSYNFYISTFPFRLVTHTVDKNCIFLLCNGILVFLAKNSGLINTSYSRSNKETLKKSNNNASDDDTLQPQPLPLETYKVDILEKDVLDGSDSLLDQENVLLEETKEEVLAKGSKSDENCAGEEPKCSTIQLVSKEEEDYNNDYEEDSNEESNVAIERYGNGTITTEELNKKFEEFIRKTKEELRLEAQQKLVMV